MGVNKVRKKTKVKKMKTSFSRRKVKRTLEWIVVNITTNIYDTLGGK